MVSTLRVSTRVAAAPAVDRAAASGEVGLLGEEAAQRLLDDEDAARRKAMQQEAKREAVRERRRWTRLEQTVWKSRPITCWADEV